jgi:hypothetical protein
VAALRSRLLRLVTPEDFDLIAQQLLRLARGGNLAAIKLLFSYVIGRPTDWVDPDTLDRQEYEQYERELSVFKTLTPIIQALPPDLALAMVHAARPIVTGEAAQELAQKCLDSLPPGYPGPEAEAADPSGEEAPEAPQAPSTNGDGEPPPAGEASRSPAREAVAPQATGQETRRPAPSTNGGARARSATPGRRKGQPKTPAASRASSPAAGQSSRAPRSRRDATRRRTPKGRPPGGSGERETGAGNHRARPGV